MNKNKIIIAIIIVSLLIILMIIGLLIISNKSNKESISNKEEFLIETNELEEVKNRNEFYDVSQCVFRYFTYIREADSASLMEILDKDYIKEFNITQKNLNENIYKGDTNNLHYYIKNIQYKTESNITQYLVDCKVSNTENEEMYLIVIFDSANMTFSVCPVNEKYKDVKDLKLKTGLKNIEISEINRFMYNSIGDEKMCKYLLDDYINKTLYFSQDLYNSLDEEYNSIRFENYENFEKYIDDNKNRLEVSDINNIKKQSEFKREEEYIEYLSGLDRIYLAKYSVESDGTAKRYICLDNFGNYYIFKVKNAMDYRLILDTYTIESDKFKTAYSEGNNQRKVQLNIDKFIKMINNKDYRNAYKVLDDNFKSNYFKTEEDFKRYVQNNFLEYSNVEYEKYTEEGDIYIYQIVLSDKTSKSDKKIRINIIMKLKDGTDFVMSFGGTN